MLALVRTVPSPEAITPHLIDEVIERIDVTPMGTDGTEICLDIRLTCGDSAQGVLPGNGPKARFSDCAAGGTGEPTVTSSTVLTLMTAAPISFTRTRENMRSERLEVRYNINLTVAV